MKIFIAAHYGFCGNGGLFGVSGAVKIAEETAQQNPDRGLYVLGELVHNHHVMTALERDHHVKTVANLDEIPANSLFLVKAHGLSPEVIAQAQTKGLTIIDATCPMVKKVHTLVKKLASEGKQIIYVASDLQHEEALGVYGEVSSQITLVTLDQLPTLTIDQPDQTVVLTQTTLSVLETATAFDILKNRYPTLTIHPHICPATTQRQQAVINLAQQADLIIIVGAVNSSNSQRLFETAKVAAPEKPVYIIDSVAELDPTWFNSLPSDTIIGLSSGASTPDDVFQAVITKIKQLTGATLD